MNHYFPLKALFWQIQIKNSAQQHYLILFKIISNMKIYTKTGDNGKTSLFNGARVMKNNARIITYGMVDEVNSHVGLLLCYTNREEKFKEVSQILSKVQNQLFVLGSDLANPDTKSK